MVRYAQVLIPKCVCEMHVNRLKPTMLSRQKSVHNDLLKILKLRYKQLLLCALCNPALAGSNPIFCILYLVVLLC
jgi:hypothetical protein